MEKTDKPISVLHICGMYVHNKGGVRRVLHELLTEQNRLEGMKAWVYGSKDGVLIANGGVQTPAGVKELMALNLDLVIFHSLYSDILSYWKITKELNKRGIPYLVQPHGNMDARAQAKSTLKKRVANRLHVNRWLKNARAIVYLCEEEKKATLMPKLDSVVIPNTFPRPFRIADQATPVNNPVRLMMLCRIAPYHKGIDRFLKTLKQLPSETAEKIQVEIYGFGTNGNIRWMEGEFASINNVRIAFKGPIFGEEKTKVFKSADLFCMFSRYEGMPLSLYEAAAMGLPLIVTEGSNRADWVEEEQNGFVLWDREEENWGEALAKAIKSYEQSPKGYRENAIRSAQNLSTWEEIAQTTKEVYGRLVNKNDE